MNGPIRDRIRELRRVRAGDLKPSPRNWRLHPRAQREALEGLLREVGYADALLARELEDGTLELVDGHLRAETTPGMEVPVLVLDVTREEADRLLATLDPLAAMATASAQKLGELLPAVPTAHPAVVALLSGLARRAGVPAGLGQAAPDDSPPPAPAAPVSRPGDLWELPDDRFGAHRLVCGDSALPGTIAALARGERADMVLTDPPYGVDYRGAGGDRRPIANDTEAGLEGLLAAALGNAFEACRPGAAWYVFAPSGPQFLAFARVLDGLGVWRQTLVWVKDSLVMGRSDYHYRHECVLYGWAPGAAHRAPPDRALDSVLEAPRPRASAEHPTMKPPALLARLIMNSTLPGQTVLEPFAGSGSAIAAGHATGRRVLAAELEPAYVDVCVRQWQALSGCAAVLAGSGATFERVAAERGVVATGAGSNG